MCMITTIPAGVDIPVDGISNGAIVNDDGHGWAVASEKFGIQMGKSMKFDIALEQFQQAREDAGQGSIGLFHSRIATHGTVDTFNVHPFWVGSTKETVVAHNGILPSEWLPKEGDRRSDTRILAARTLPHYLRKDTGLPSRRGGREIGRRIGNGNKLAILSVASGQPKMRLVNAHLGEFRYGAWFSNTGYMRSYYSSRWSNSWWGYDGDLGGYAGHRRWNDDEDYTDWWERYKQNNPVALGGKPDTGGCADGLVDRDPETGRFVKRETVTVDTILTDEEMAIIDAVDSDEPISFYDAPCECCLMRGTVRIDTSVCTNCLTCQDCWEFVENCPCPPNVEARRQQEMDEEAAEVKALEAPWIPQFSSSSTTGRQVG